MMYGLCTCPLTHTHTQGFNNKCSTTKNTYCIMITRWYTTLPHKHEMCVSTSKLSTFPSLVCVCADWLSSAASVVSWLCSKGGRPTAQSLRYSSCTTQNNEFDGEFKLFLCMTWLSLTMPRASSSVFYSKPLTWRTWGGKMNRESQTTDATRKKTKQKPIPKKNK